MTLAVHGASHPLDRHHVLRVALLPRGSI